VTAHNSQYKVNDDAVLYATRHRAYFIQKNVFAYSNRMLLPRGLTKKKTDPLSARRRKIEDKERPFIGAPKPEVSSDEQLDTSKISLHHIWSNAVFISLSEHKFSSDDVRVSRMRKAGCKPILGKSRSISIILKLSSLVIQSPRVRPVFGRQGSQTLHLRS
jgi:hypothetical protein